MSPRPPVGSVRTRTRGPVRPVAPAGTPLSPGRRVPAPRLAGAAARLVATAAVASVALVVGAPAAGATTTGGEEPGPDARIIVSSLQAVVGPPADPDAPVAEQQTGLPSTFSARVLVENRTTEPLDGLDLVVTVHERVRTRSALRLALDPDDASGLGREESIAIDQDIEPPVPPGEFAQLEIELDAAAAGLIGDDDVVLHPIRIAVTQAVRVLDEVRTVAIGVARPVARPLETTVLAPLDGPAPSTQPPASAIPELLPGGRLDRLLRAVEAAPPGTVTLAPAAHALEDLGRLADAAVPGASDLLSRARIAAADLVAGVVSSPYALADVPALTSRSDTTDLAGRAIVAGRQRLPRLLGMAPSAAHLAPSPQTSEALDLAPTDVLVTPWADSTGPDLDANPSADIPPALRVARSPSGRTMDVLVGDPWATQILAEADGRHGWEVEAHRVVAETAMTFAQAPSRQGRTFAVVPPVGWEAPGRMPDQLFRRIADAPWLRPADPFTVASRGAVTVPWSPTDTLSRDRTPLLSRLAFLRERLAGLANAVVDVEEQPAVVAREDDLLRAMTVWPSSDPLDRSRRLLDELDQGIAEAVGEVVVPRGGIVTLASERGVIPVTVQHPEGVAMDVLVEVTSQGLLTFDDDTALPVRLEPGGAATVSFDARARGRGTFPVQVSVLTPGGEVVLASGLVSVRASAVSRPALIGVGLVVLLLLVIGRVRRPRKPQLEVVR